MSLSAARLVGKIHGAPLQLVLAAAGGGSSAIHELLRVAGASRTVLEGVVPYSTGAMVRFLGHPPRQYCSPVTARAMAMAAFQRAIEFMTADHVADHVAGVACTASLATDRTKRGPHRAHLAVQTAGETVAASLHLLAGRRSRFAEEKLIGRWLLNQIAETAGLDPRLDLDRLESEEVAISRRLARPGWSDLLLGRAAAVRHRDDDAMVQPHGEVSDAPRRAVFPGAFNPRHAGHRRMAETARRRLGCEVEHEISIANVDKRPLDYIDLEGRLEQFTPGETVWFTRAALFQDKADLFPSATFVVGADTIRRIADPGYYGDDPDRRDAAIEHFARRRCRFLVFGRVEDEGFRTLGDLSLPPRLLCQCDEVPASEFREDIASSELRKDEG